MHANGIDRAPVLLFVPILAGAAIYVGRKGIVENEGRLENAASGQAEAIYLKGDTASIADVQGLDRAIRRLTAKFNGVSRVPEDVVREIDKHIRDVRGALGKVTAVREVPNDIFEMTVSGQLTRQQPCAQVEYKNTFRSMSGTEIEQRVARISFGMRA